MYIAIELIIPEHDFKICTLSKKREKDLLNHAVYYKCSILLQTKRVTNIYVIKQRRTWRILHSEQRVL